MKPSRVLGFLIFVASVHCRSEVHKTTLHYSCCSLTFRFDESCENIWNTKGQTFARIEGIVKECVLPCKTIEDERMTLDACVNMTQTAICTDAVGLTTETRLNYIGQACPSPVSFRESTGNRGSADWVLLIFGCILLCII